MKKFVPLLLITIISLPVIGPFLQKGFFWTQDIIYLTRIYAMSGALANGQFPVRWISIFRYGEPLFNYYAPLPYYFGAVFHALGFNFIDSSKVVFILITLFSTFFMYLLAKEFWGKAGGILSAVLYAYAPYRAVDLFIRGSLSEVFAFTWLPLIFWSTYKYYRTQKISYFLLTGLSFSLLILTHNISAMIFLPFFLAFLLALTISKKSLKFAISIPLFLIISFGLSGFYWIPAIFENNFVQSSSAILKFDFFVNQFVKWSEFIKPQWDSVTITHEVGSAQLVFLILSVFTLLLIFKKERKQSLLIVFLFMLLVASLFMQTTASLSIWQIFSPLSFVQFPWRFSEISMFTASLLGGSIFLLLNKNRKISAYFLFTSIAVIIFLQGRYFLNPKIDLFAVDEKYINLNEAFLPKEYLPAGVKENPPKQILSPVSADNFQDAGAVNIVKNSQSYSFTIDINKPQKIAVPIYYFPGWQVLINNKNSKINKQAKTGLIILDLPTGKNDVGLYLRDTPIRSNANKISILAGLVFISLVIVSNRRRQRPS